MKVSELIKKLADYNPNADVLTIKHLDGINVGVETAVHYRSADDKKENATEVYIGVEQLAPLSEL